MAKTTPGTAHRHKDSRGKWVTEELPHTHDYTVPAPQFTADQVTRLLTLISDDNFNEWERNLLLEFTLPE